MRATSSSCIGRPGSFGSLVPLSLDHTLCGLSAVSWSIRAVRAIADAGMADLVVPGGLLICLEFPLFKDLSLPGPPWPLNGVYWNLLSEGGDGIVHSSMPKQNAGRGKFERKWYIKPERSYESGKGTDMLGIYARK